MNNVEFSDQFDLLYNNITSNQAPGLNEWEKSVFLTKAQYEILKNYFLPQSNPKQAGFDANQKRQIDFSNILVSGLGIPLTLSEGKGTIDPRAFQHKMPVDMLFIINESVQFYSTISRNAQGIVTSIGDLLGIRQVVPIDYNEYMRLMSKPFKEPLKNQAWRLMADYALPTSGIQPIAEILITSADLNAYGYNTTTTPRTQKEYGNYILYVLRYVKRPRPIILANFSSTLGENLTVDGKNGSEAAYSNNNANTTWDPCELNPAIHEEILQRAVELAKVAWTQTGGDNTQMVIQAGQRSE